MNELIPQTDTDLQHNDAAFPKLSRPTTPVEYIYWHLLTAGLVGTVAGGIFGPWNVALAVGLPISLWAFLMRLALFANPPQPAPAGLIKPPALLQDAISDLEKNRFEVGELFVFKAAVDVPCAIAIHPSEPILALAYCSDTAAIIDLVSDFGKEADSAMLTSTNHADGGSSPRPPQHMCQVFPRGDTHRLLRAHRDALVLLGQHGLRPMRVLRGDFKRMLFDILAWQRAYLWKWPAWRSSVTIFRSLTKRSPQKRPISEQRAVLRWLRRRGPPSR